MVDPPGLMSPIYPHVTGGTGLNTLYIYRHSCKILYIFCCRYDLFVADDEEEDDEGMCDDSTTSSEASVPY